jgi:hypothetical protein
MLRIITLKLKNATKTERHKSSSMKPIDIGKNKLMANGKINT